ncbi:MAG: hypothetical protein ACYC6B_00895 [Thermoleophilia bacterium]
MVVQKKNGRLIAVALIVVLAMAGGGFLLRARSADSDGEKKATAAAVFDQWDQTVAETSDLRIRLDGAHDSYLALGGRLDQAVAGNDTGAIARLMPQAQASLDEQTRLLSEMEVKINVRVNVAINMNTAIGELPPTAAIGQLQSVYDKARKTNVALSEALSNNRQRLQFEQQILWLFSEFAQGKLDHANFTTQFGFNRSRSSELGGLVDEMTRQASALEPDTIGASRFLT